MTRYVIFDLDDTLVDASAWKHACAALAAEQGLAATAVADAFAAAAPGSDMLTVLGELGLADAAACERRLRTLLAELDARHGAPFADSDACLHALTDSGLTVLLSTGSPAHRVERVLSDTGWDCFALALGSDPKCAKGPEHFRLIGEHLAHDPDWTLAAATVGDSPLDMRLGAEHGVPVRVGLDRDGTRAQALRDAGATHVITGLGELAALLA